MRKKVYRPSKIQPNTTTARVHAVLQDGEPHAISELEVQAGPKYHRGIAGLLKRRLKAHRDHQYKGRSALVLRDDTIQLTTASLEPQAEKSRRGTVGKRRT